MTIASAIATKQQQVADAYTVCNNKGATMPQTQNLTNLATCISSISGGGSSPVITSLSVTPTTSSQTITAPIGTDGYSPVNVAAVTSSIDANITAGNIKNGVTILSVTGTYEGSGGVGINREVVNGVYKAPSTSFTFKLPSDATSMGNYALAYAFYGCTGLTSVDFSNVTKITNTRVLLYAFYGCTGLTSVDFSNVTALEGTVSGAQMERCFSGCTSLTTVSFPKLTKLTGSMNYCFHNCTSLTTVSFPKLTTSSFGSAKTQFNNMLSNTGTTVTHTLHFPSNLTSKISALTGYPTFGGTSGYVTIAFDLPATS